MKRLRRRVQRDERGAALILAIAFMLVVGGIAAAASGSVSSGVSDHSVLTKARNREYAADGAIEQSIVRIRGLSNPGSNATECNTADMYPALDGIVIRVDCANTPSVSISSTGAPVSQNNVSFAACTNLAIPCTPAASSATSIAIANGSKVFTTQSGLGYVVGTRVRASSKANGANYMEGRVTAYSGTTLTVNVDTIGGSGTFADWSITRPDLIITAHINFQNIGSGAGSYVSTFVQAWSVNA